MVRIGTTTLNDGAAKDITLAKFKAKLSTNKELVKAMKREGIKWNELWRKLGGETKRNVRQVHTKTN